MTYIIEGEKIDLEVGQALCVRRGQTHKLDNLTDLDAQMLVVSMSGLFEEDYFLRIADPQHRHRRPPDFAALYAVQARHGVTVA